MFHRGKERITDLNYIYNNSGVEAMKMLRVKNATFNQLMQTLTSRQLLRVNIHTCIEDQLAMFLHVLGHNERFQVIHNT
jgi:hypothetical protein